MKLSLTTLLVGLLPLAMAKSVIVTYPKGTPQSVIDSGKKSIVDAGGHITHDYHLIRGFSAYASPDAIQGLDKASSEYQPTVENVQNVSVN